MGIFNTIFYQPLFNALILLYNLLPGKDLGMAILILTVLIRILLSPLNQKAIESQRALSKLEPQLKEIQKKFKDDKEGLTKETLELYKSEKINPFLGILLILIQLPVLIALYEVFSASIFKKDFSGLYSFVARPDVFSPNFFKIDLSTPNFLMAFFAGILQYIQVKFQDMGTKIQEKSASEFSKILQKQMLYFFPAFTFLILLKIPSAISLYLIVSTLFSILQTFYVQKRKP